MINDCVKRNVCMFFALLVLTSLLFAQKENRDSKTQVSSDSLLIIARSIIDSARCHVLVTVDENGKPHTREMDPFAPEENMTIWLGTSPKTRKVKQIEKNPNVVMFYYDTKGISYVALEGKARIVNDPAQKAKHLKEYWKLYYPDQDKDYVLIQIVPDIMELISYKHNILGTTDSFLPSSVKFNKSKDK